MFRVGATLGLCNCTDYHSVSGYAKSGECKIVIYCNNSHNIIIKMLKVQNF